MQNGLGKLEPDDRIIHRDGQRRLAVSDAGDKAIMLIGERIIAGIEWKLRAAPIHEKPERMACIEFDTAAFSHHFQSVRRQVSVRERPCRSQMAAYA